MVKGVNKQIIEVNNTDSIYFERAVFYLRSGVRTLPTEISSREIEKFIYDSGYLPKKKFPVGRVVICSALVLVTALVILILI